MGREARSAGTWGADSGAITVLLESSEIIVRGAFRKRAMLAALTGVRADGETLAFTADGDDVALQLGAKPARAWAAAMLAPPPTLAKKLGIIGTTRIYARGKIDDAALRAALAVAASCAAKLDEADLVILRTDDTGVIERLLGELGTASKNMPVWIIYRKGSRAPLGETRLRLFMRAAGWIDTKVAAVSENLTALRFSDRK